MLALCGAQGRHREACPALSPKGGGDNATDLQSQRHRLTTTHAHRDTHRERAAPPRARPNREAFAVFSRGRGGDGELGRERDDP